MKCVQIFFYSFLLTIQLTACSNSGSGSSSANGSTYQAQITRTAYGIPHISADDWASLGYGHGYAYAQDNFCVLMKEIVYANGQSAELMGEADGDLNSDFVYRWLNSDETDLQNRFIDPQPEHLQQLVNGYAAGMNRYLQETGLENLAEGSAGCRNASWVRSITALDLWKYYRKVALQGSTDNNLVRNAIVATNAPRQTMTAAPRPLTEKDIGPALRKASRALKSDNGSNAIAAGRDATQTGSGILLGNPHQPWQGSGRWYQVHLTIPGVYDVMGATLQGLPMVGIGFNQNLAWSHTVSYANRFTLYELTLNPDNPMQYRYDGEWRDIRSQTVTAKIKQSDGSSTERQHTFYLSHYGPIIDLNAVNSLLGGWPMLTGSVLSIRDANIDNVRGIEQWIAMGQAQSMDEFTQALQTVGNPLFHTLAADREGQVFYGDISAVPHVTQIQLDSCTATGLGKIIASFTGNTIISLDGSTSTCEWGSDADSPNGSNIYGYKALPKSIRTDYVANSNNSYWLSNADHPLTGFPSVMGALGHEGEQQFIRTQITHQMVAERINATDGFSATPKFTLQTMQQLMYSNRVLAAENSMADIQSICQTAQQQSPLSDVETRAVSACAVLNQWDKRVDLESRGAHLFTEFWNALEDELEFNNVLKSDDLWKIDFDTNDPVHTPRGFDTSLESNRQRIINALSDAVIAVQNAGLELDAAFGDVQFFMRNNEQIPIHGGQGTMGVFGVIKVELENGGYSNITGGNSYIQTVTWDESDCPIAEGILVHSQSTDPASEHYGDQTVVYSDKGWITLPFCEDAIKAAQIGEVVQLSD